MPYNKSTSNVAQMKLSNRAAILDCLRHRPMSRADLSRATGLTKPAITMLSNELVSEGLLCEAGLSERTQSPGRTSMLLDIVSDFAFAVGVTLHRKKIGVCVSDLKADNTDSVLVPSDSFDSRDSALDYIFGKIEELISKNRLSMSRCVGIGISSPGPVDCFEGKILDAPDFPLFSDCGIKEIFEKRFGLPVSVENNSVSLALSEFYHAKPSVPDNMLFIAVSDGIGSSVLQNGKLLRGSHGFAGELGHISIDRNGKKCSCGNNGCLELYASLKAMKERFGFDSYPELVDNFLYGGKDEAKAVGFLSEALGAAVVSAVNLFDPDFVVLFGEYSYHADILTKRIGDYVKKHSVISRAHEIIVKPSDLTQSSANAASAISALNAFFSKTVL